MVPLLLVQVTAVDVVSATFQVNVWLTARLWLSVTVKVTEHAHPVVGVPVMAPVDELRERPAGRPVCEYETVTPESLLSVGVSVVMAVPMVADCVPGLVNDRLSTFQFKVTVALVAAATPAA